MLQTSAANQTTHCIIPRPACQRRTHARVASAVCSGGAIAPVGGLPDNGARTGHSHGDTDESFSAAERVHRAAVGRAADLAGSDGQDRSPCATRRRRGAGSDLHILGRAGRYAACSEGCEPGNDGSRRIARIGGDFHSRGAVRAAAACIAVVCAGRRRARVARSARCGAFGRASLISRRPARPNPSAFALARRARSG